MSAKLNKKVLCFIDEYGTPGRDDLCFGSVIVWSRDNGRLDKCFSDQLYDNANEIHAVNLTDEYLKELMQNFYAKSPNDCFTLVNRKVSAREGTEPLLYAWGLIEAVKVSVSAFRESILNTKSINNVEVIVDRNQYNTHTDFEAEISRAKSEDNKFKAVTHVSAIDSSASRILQLADIAAYSRKFINNRSMRAEELHRLYGIQIK